MGYSLFLRESYIKEAVGTCHRGTALAHMLGTVRLGHHPDSPTALPGVHVVTVFLAFRHFRPSLKGALHDLAVLTGGHNAAPLTTRVGRDSMGIRGRLRRIARCGYALAARFAGASANPGRGVSTAPRPFFRILRR